MSEGKECSRVVKCSRMDPTDPLCYANAGRLEDGKPANCLRQQSLWYGSGAYHMVRIPVYALRGIGRGANRVVDRLVNLTVGKLFKGALRAEDADID